jgi:hypothetical protein
MRTSIRHRWLVENDSRIDPGCSHISSLSFFFRRILHTVSRYLTARFCSALESSAPALGTTRIYTLKSLNEEFQSDEIYIPVEIVDFT